MVQRPSPEIRHVARIGGKILVLGERRGREVEQPGGHHAAAAPDLGDVGKVEVEPVLGGERFVPGVPAGCRNLPQQACIIPYSMPLWIILTKCPEPFGPGMKMTLPWARIASLPECRRRHDLPCPRRERAEHRGQVARPPPSRRRSSGNNRARAPTRRRWCRHRGSGCRVPAARWRGAMSSFQNVLPPSMIVSSAASRAVSSETAQFEVAAPASSISQTRRGGWQPLDENPAEPRPTGAPSQAEREARLPGCESNTTHSWPLRISRRAIFAPMRPKPDDTDLH